MLKQIIASYSIGSSLLVNSIPSSTIIIDRRNDVLFNIELDINNRPLLEDFISFAADYFEVNAQAALFVVEHEGGFRSDVLSGKVFGDEYLTCQRTGLPQRAMGMWQINTCYHPTISQQTALDIRKATFLMMPLFKEHPEQWSTYQLYLKSQGVNN